MWDDKIIYLIFIGGAGAPLLYIWAYMSKQTKQNKTKKERKKKRELSQA